MVYCRGERPFAPTLSRRESSVHREGNACYPVGLVGGEVKGGVGNVLRLAHPGEVVVLQHLLFYLLRVSVLPYPALVHRGIYCPWADTIHPDPFWGQIQGHAPGQVDHRPLGGAIGYGAGKTYQSQDGGDVYNVPLRLHYFWCRILTHQIY